jgi:hypothetical protein
MTSTHSAQVSCRFYADANPRVVDLFFALKEYREMQQTRQLLCQYRHYAQVASRASLLIREKQMKEESEYEQLYGLPSVALHHFAQLAGRR